MQEFSHKLQEFLSDFGKGRKMVLSTSENGRVSSRMMSVIQINGEFFFQTDRTLRKYSQLSANRNAALCIDNIQIEGMCEELGRPVDHSAFSTAFRECFRGSYDAYTALENERLFVLRPLFIERWIYNGNVPYIETFDIISQSCVCERYKGI